MLKKRIQPGISFKNKGGKALGTSPVWIEARGRLHPVSLLQGPEHSLDSWQWPGVVDLDPRLLWRPWKLIKRIFLSSL